MYRTSSLRNRTRLHPGFTLIELLVVIAIVAILAAILFPVFAQAREKARQVSCLSNTKQLALATMQYVQDYDEVFPSGNQYGAGKGWGGQIFPYIKSVDTYRCPDDSTKTTFWIGTYYVLSYGYNRALTILPNDTPQRCSLATLRAPSKSVEFFEIINNDARIDVPTESDSCTGFGNMAFDGYGTNAAINNNQCLADTGYMGNPPVISDPTSVTHEASYRPEGRHQGGSNFVLSDGHAKWFRPGQVSPGINAVHPGDAQGANNVWYGYAYFPTAAGTDVSSFAATFSNN